MDNGKENGEDNGNYYLGLGFRVEALGKPLRLISLKSQDVSCLQRQTLSPKPQKQTFKHQTEEPPIPNCSPTPKPPKSVSPKPQNPKGFRV